VHLLVNDNHFWNLFSEKQDANVVKSVRNVAIGFKFAVALSNVQCNYELQAGGCRAEFMILGVGRHSFLHHHNQTGSGGPINNLYINYRCLYLQGKNGRSVKLTARLNPAPNQNT
jgi:hypothetical protein